jgi:2-polyprenyl-3-methyl-5-hydroxy-6-metoxy-1,4-benzoquinol methylase
MDTVNTETAHKRILVVAEHRKGHGSGHLHRCARLVRELEGSIDWLLPATVDEAHHDRSAVLRILGMPRLPATWVDRPEGLYDLVILDRRSVDLEEIATFSSSGIVIGIGLGGAARERVDYLIDTLGTPPGAPRANVTDSGLLHLPEAVRDDWPETVRSVLITFGGEMSSGNDAADDLIAAATRLQEESSLEVSIAIPGSSGDLGPLRVLDAPGGLSEQLHRFDALITHYGLTAYEATWARLPVVLVNPGRYHTRLAERAGFVTATSVAEAGRRLREVPRLVAAGKRIRPAGRSSLGALINGLELPVRTTGPSVGGRFHPAVERFGERTFFREEETGLTFMRRYRSSSILYDHDYFFSQYERQYGKTYLEDFAHIQTMGTRRMADILARYPGGSGGIATTAPRLLDIGCAYGPFLTAAAAAGCTPHGIDISCEAVRYVRETLGFAAECGDVLDGSTVTDADPYDIVTMWYVIEHFADLDRLLRRVAAVLRVGGTFAFSTPSLRGVSGRRNVREFLRGSPEDHYTVFDPRSVRRVLSHFGFEVRSIRSNGHHPERFGLPLEGGPRQWRRLLAAAILLFSRAARLGDTFEVIAEKVS